MYIYPNPERSKTDIDTKHASIEWTRKVLDPFAFIAALTDGLWNEFPPGPHDVDRVAISSPTHIVASAVEAIYEETFFFWFW
jgi:hypothetical protein